MSAIVAKVTNDDDDYGNICIMVKCLYVCLSVCLSVCHVFAFFLDALEALPADDNVDDDDNDDYGDDDDNEDNVCVREGKSGSQ